ncbi:sulfotransferase family protein [Pseudomarimonas arenosa]|uniref:Sulfotransferase n=1 Tax=Pseudomarimonas arenosa TaxID=2774145 RepID=A0AAW3ZPB2_9GAMM|nr:sulfotransferase [Pseudomarimonas arenosa]MBD8526484.1 sulfotransferase [Pseudomarimonas arenosa]
MQAGRRSCERLADLESTLLADEMRSTEVRAPIFIAGVARSGSTILLEALASLPGLASARYRDFPPIWFPYWWDRLRAQLPLPSPPSRPRAHADGIEVTPDSPEACDELFWMHFVPGRHQVGVDQRLNGDYSNPRFEAFYRRHLQKVLYTRGASRYLCKGNYNLLRLPYLKRVFPDARFVVPVRDPIEHVVSLVRQHERFDQLARTWPSVGTQLARSGHFEFGPQRRAECAGDSGVAALIESLFRVGDNIAAYAHQWAASYAELARVLENDRQLRDAVLIVSFESLCCDTEKMLERLAEHCQLEAAQRQQLLRDWGGRMRAPARREISSEAQAQVLSICAKVAERIGLGGFGEAAG